MLKVSSKSKSSQSKKEGHRRHWDPERELPKHPGYKLVPCKYCSRTFFAKRIEYHQEICGAKRFQTKRPVYDSSKSRISGTVAEHFQSRGQGLASSSYRGTLNQNWRANGEFNKSGTSYMNIREESGKATGAGLGLEVRGRHLAYVQCPICGRRFNDDAAARHIPHCKNYVSRKGNTSFTTATFAPPSQGRSRSNPNRP